MPALLTENGFMDNEREAMLMIDQDFQKEVAVEHAKGICDYFNMPYVPEDTIETLNEETPIIGSTEVSAEQLCKYLLFHNPNPKLDMDPLEWCKLWIEEAYIESVNAGPAFCQCMHETGYLKFGGQVLPKQNNFGGIGATNNSQVGKGAWFDTLRLGVRASIQHLKAYGSKLPITKPCIDPRFHLVTRGSAPCSENLGGKWAWPGYDKSKYNSLEDAIKEMDTYGHSIIRKYHMLKRVRVIMDLEIHDKKIESIKRLLHKAMDILDTI